MALFTPSEIGVPERKSGTKLSVGSRGLAPKQGLDGKAVVRNGGSSKQVDFDVYSEGYVDLTNAEWDSVESTKLQNPSNIGGTSEVSAGFSSLDSNPFEFVIYWLECDTCEDVMFKEVFSSDGDDLRADLITVKSDVVKYKLRDTSGETQNRVRGTINAH